jgi:CrcB protein
MIQILLVALGGALGSVARYGVGVGAARLLGLSFPYGTLLINVLGGLAMGVLAARIGPEHEPQRLLIGVGVLGGFTTFSTFSLESVRLLESDVRLALLYILSSVILSIGACWAGLSLGRA